MTIHGKEEARRIVQARLDELTPDGYVASAQTVRQQVSSRLAELQHSGEVRTILSYHAAAKLYEIDLSPLERQFEGIRFDYVSFDANAPLPTKSYDVILVPLYGFSVDGYRLGHGGGWYDKFLATQPKAYLVGVGLEIGLVAFIAEPHDIAMDNIVTECGIMRN